MRLFCGLHPDSLCFPGSVLEQSLVFVYHGADIIKWEINVWLHMVAFIKTVIFLSFTAFNEWFQAWRLSPNFFPSCIYVGATTRPMNDLIIHLRFLGGGNDAARGAALRSDPIPGGPAEFLGRACASVQGDADGWRCWCQVCPLIFFLLSTASRRPRLGCGSLRRNFWAFSDGSLNLYAWKPE